MNNTQAFPNYEYDVNDRGMTLRDYFAAKAMQAELGDGVALSAMSMVAKRAYIMADAMLEARK